MGDRVFILSERAKVALCAAALGPVTGMAEPGAGEPAFPGAHGDRQIQHACAHHRFDRAADDIAKQAVGRGEVQVGPARHGKRRRVVQVLRGKRFLPQHYWLAGVVAVALGVFGGRASRGFAALDAFFEVTHAAAQQQAGVGHGATHRD